LNRPLPLDALAAMASLSRSRYAELFRQQTGYAPIDYSSGSACTAPASCSIPLT
jgi:transcriptional regulator GlxA family with amidase domain